MVLFIFLFKIEERYVKKNNRLMKIIYEIKIFIYLVIKIRYKIEKLIIYIN